MRPSRGISERVPTASPLSSLRVGGNAGTVADRPCILYVLDARRCPKLVGDVVPNRHRVRQLLVDHGSSTASEGGEMPLGTIAGTDHI